MQNIRAFFLAVSGIAVIALVAVLTASLTAAFAGMLAIFTGIRLLSSRLKPVPVRATTAKPENMRVWNDGRGTIIDL
ncbi:hypothetical protein [Neorhizobium sp. JUb45]|uniref:hypothetical protein n=1 Tax=unclassified Neorhizobium TaxID=2629175 RepID=UPI00104484D0|nr:hypothetical protein [Neorhizobium sp. JUb45]TCQ99689.1 hypothetical protein EDF70_10890 [Neorhizobium sp. JUb45]